MSDDPSARTPAAPETPIPVALRPHGSIVGANEPIPLYAGQTEVTQAGNTFVADASVSLRWLPSPAVYFEATNVPSGSHPRLGELSLGLEDGTSISDCLLSGLNSSMDETGNKGGFSGVINDRVVRPADGPVDQVIFMLPNFDQPIGGGVRYPDGSDRAVRLTLVGGGWVITLDGADDYANVLKHLKANSGFGITQVGRLEREDKTAFLVSDAQAALRALAWYVSFAAGRWTGPCLPTGFDAGGRQVWQVWDYNRTVPFRRRVSWVDHVHGDQFEQPFPGFMGLWLDDTWEEVIRVAVHWYIEANAQAGSIEGSIVLTQTAFELLASAVLTDHDGWLSQEGYDKLAAADRIRLLFLWADIPTGIPDELGHLVKLARSYEEFMVNKVPDAASAMTAIRNTITHPTRKNREKFGRHSYEARDDAWTLGLRNLELCLLRLFNHRGSYADRIKRKWQGKVEPVPWL